jgi:hypothetical protein
VLLLVTIGLVVVAAVALVIGFVSNQLPPIYISIACSFVAAIVLAMFSRLSRRQAAQATVSGGPAPLVGGEDFIPAPAPISSRTDVLVRAGSAAPSLDEEAEAAPASSLGGWADAPIFPISDYDELRVAEILPLLPELDADELEQVRNREQGGRNRATIVSRVSQLLVSAPAPASADWGGGRVTDVVVADVAVFPIADYEDLRVAEILPLLAQLEPDELDEVAARERAGASRGTILTRIQALGGRGATVTAELARRTRKTAKTAKTTTAPRAKRTGAAAKAAPAKKTAAKAAPAKKTAAKTAPAKKTAAKTVPAKKAAKAGKGR